ncbi:myb-like protein I isoform X2 [Solenopsis invicta]|uniref:myb-like protein I isoform X2 n=1 Tax=Solenopsis invicta TaxID=13686 RepID=UPI00193E92D9|nr:myb-like protein I isoform X2 [Solenopsis invicta]
MKIETQRTPIQNFYAGQSIFITEMEQRGYNKTAEQMKLKLKNLKLAYFKCKRDNNVSGAATTRCSFYDEMEILYGCRPNAAASSCNSGIDTAISNINDNISNVIENEHDNIDNDNGGADNNGSSDGNDKAHSSNSTDNILPVEVNLEENEEPAKKRRKTKQKSGRESYKTALQNCTEKWFTLQNTTLNSMLEHQDKRQKELIQQEMDKQREWEQHEMEKERNFQREQTNFIMQTFLQSIQMLKPQMPLLPQNNYPSVKLIPINNVGFSPFKINQKVKENTKMQTEATSKEDLFTYPKSFSLNYVLNYITYCQKVSFMLLYTSNTFISMFNVLCLMF